MFADAELAQRVRLYGLKDMTGAVMSAQDAHLVMRGQNLALRMDRHCQSAQKVAEFIAAHPAAAAVHYPACPALRSTRWPAADAPDGRDDCFELRGGLQAGALHGQLRSSPAP